MIGVVLSKRDFKESDIVVNIYSKEQGKQELVARGAKKIKSKNASALETCSLLDFGTANGKSMDYLTEVSIARYFKNIREDLKKSLVSQYLANLIDRVAHKDQQDEYLFNLFVQWLTYVNGGVQVNSAIVGSFILKFFSYLGFKPDLNYSDQTIGFSPAKGGVVEDNKKEEVIFCSQEELDALKKLLVSDFEDISDSSINRRVHKMVYEFVIYHSEYKISDWKQILA